MVTCNPRYQKLGEWQIDDPDEDEEIEGAVIGDRDSQELLYAVGRALGAPEPSKHYCLFKMQQLLMICSARSKLPGHIAVDMPSSKS
jgi:hypothetical protein